MSDIFSNVDLDLSVMPEWVQNDLGIGGLIGEAESSFASLPDYEDINRAEMIPRSKWKDLISQHSEEQLKGVRMIFNQGNEPSCTANAIAGAMQFRAFWQYGETLYRKLSAVSLYHRIKLRGGGSYISQGMQEAHDDGLLPLNDDRNKADFEHTHPARGENTRLPSGWKTTAANFRCTFSRARSIEAKVSALLANKPIVVGRQGHAIYYCRNVYRGSGLYFDYPNSWRESWGTNGHGYDSERLGGNLDGFVVESVTVRDEVEPVELA